MTGPQQSAASIHDDQKAGAAVIERGERLNQARRRLFPHALLVGLMTGVLAVAFRLSLEQGEELRSQLIEWSRETDGFGLFLLCVGSGSLVGIALWLVNGFCPEAAGSGIPHLRLMLRERGQLDWRRVIPVKFVSGVLGITGGLCLGREGPTIQMGASLGAMWGNSLLGKGTDRRTLLVTGASAGLAAAFNAPMAGILFSIEELHINLPESAFFAAMISCISADLLARGILGQTPVLHATLTQIPPLESLPFFVVLGLLNGCLGWGFNHSLVWTSKRLAFRSTRWNVAKVLVAAGILAVVGWIYPALLGGGLVLSNEALNGQGTVAWLATMLVLRFMLSIGSYSIGTAGGIFAPLLVMGGLLGLLTGEISQRIFPNAVPGPMS